MLRRPLVHFVVLGGLLFVGSRRLETPPRPRVVLSADDVASLRAAWTRTHGSAPAPEGALVDAAVDDAILLQEAQTLGIDRRDAAVQERLVRLGRFVGEDTASNEAVEAEARRLHLDRSDLLIRRHLVQMMRLAIARPAASDVPTDAECSAWLARHADEFAEPARVRLTQVYLSRGRHGAALDADARVLLEGLRRDGVGPDHAPERGDPFIRGADAGLASRVELERTFGTDVARVAADAPVGRWVGPVPSPWGVHLVWVRERVPGGMPPLAAVRTRVVHAMLEERSVARRDERLQALRARYDVVIERP